MVNTHSAFTPLIGRATLHVTEIVISPWFPHFLPPEPINGPNWSSCSSVCWSMTLKADAVKKDDFFIGEFVNFDIFRGKVGGCSQDEDTKPALWLTSQSVPPRRIMICTMMRIRFYVWCVIWAPQSSINIYAWVWDQHQTILSICWEFWALTRQTDTFIFQLTSKTMV